MLTTLGVTMSKNRYGRGNNTQSEIHRLLQAGIAVPAWRPDADYSWFDGPLPRLHQRQVEQKRQMPLTMPDNDLGFFHTGD